MIITLSGSILSVPSAQKAFCLGLSCPNHHLHPSPEAECSRIKVDVRHTSPHITSESGRKKSRKKTLRMRNLPHSQVLLII